MIDNIVYLVRTSDVAVLFEAKNNLIQNFLNEFNDRNTLSTAR